MGVKEYLETTAVFTIEEFKAEFPAVTGYNLLSRAIKSGKALQVTRGLYVSNTGRFTGVQHDRFKIAAKLSGDVVFAYHSALELHGVAHSFSNRVQYYSETSRKEIEFQGNSYKRYCKDDDSVLLQAVRADAFGEVYVTTKEQTIIDCMQYLGRSGGSEEVLRSVSGFPYIDVAIIKDKTLSLNSSAVARIGWLLERKREEWNVSEKDLLHFEETLTGNAYRFASGTSADKGWSKRWKLILPVSESEMLEWV